MVARFLITIHTRCNKGGLVELPTNDLVLGGAGGMEAGTLLIQHFQWSLLGIIRLLLFHCCLN